jgi:hypothetical protein
MFEKLSLAEVYERWLEADFAGFVADAEDCLFEIANRGFTLDQAREAYEATKVTTP